MAEAEARKADLRTSLDGLREDANDNTDAIAEAVRRMFDRARAAATTTAAFNRFVDEFVGARWK